MINMYAGGREGMHELVSFVAYYDELELADVR